MSIITKMRKQTCVWWSSTGVDAYGRPTWTTPVEIDCRWEDVIQEFVNDDGEERFSRSIVYVDRDMKVGDVLKLGSLDSGIDEDNPKENDDAWEVSRFSKLPNLKNTEVLRTVFL